MNLYDKRILATILEQIPENPSFINKTFFPIKYYANNGANTNKVDVDIWKGIRGIAPYSNPELSGKVINKIGFTTKTFDIPLLKIKDVTTVKDLEIRLPGTTIYTDDNATDRFIELIATQMQNFIQYINRTVELMSIQSLVNGEITIKGDGIDYTIDYELTNKTTLSGNNVWGGTTAKPLENLKTWVRACKKNGYTNPNIAIMSWDAYNAFVNDAGVKDLLKIYQGKILDISPRFIDSSITYGGFIPELNLSLYKYESWYYDTIIDSELPMLPDGVVLLLSDSANYKTYYGVIVTADEDTNNLIAHTNTDMIADIWTEKDPATKFLTIQSRPLPVPQAINSWYSAKVM